MSIEHTPGPWKASDYQAAVVTAENGGACVVEICTFPVLAAFRAVSLPAPGTHATVDGQRANARLIATAPELLAELKSALFYIDTYGGEVTARFAAGGNRARVAAIVSKAEGDERHG